MTGNVLRLRDDPQCEPAAGEWIGLMEGRLIDERGRPIKMSMREDYHMTEYGVTLMIPLHIEGESCPGEREEMTIRCC
jgi:hypothetical protein